MKIALSAIRFSKKRNHHKYFKCKRCGFISTEKAACPVCRREGRRIRMKRA